IRTIPGEYGAIDPPMVNIRTMAAPTYMPAMAERTRWPTRDRRCSFSFMTACSLRPCTASTYIPSPADQANADRPPAEAHASRPHGAACEERRAGMVRGSWFVLSRPRLRKQGATPGRGASGLILLRVTRTLHAPRLAGARTDAGGPRPRGPC